MKPYPLVIALLVVCVVGSLTAQAAPIRKKLIETGWDQPDTATLRKNVADMEQTPFDGVVVSCTGVKADGTKTSLRGVFSSTPWEAGWFQNCIDDLQATPFKRFTDNFVIIGANPGNVDWFDDEGWKNVVEHWRITARVAKQGKLTGILFDPEPYTKPYGQFKYALQAQKDQHTFAEYVAKARQRGQEVMQAVAAEYPDITFYTYFMNSVNAIATGNPDPAVALLSSGYGLYPSFIDGWLDVTPPTVKFIDGCENAYLFNSTQQFLHAAVQMKVDAQSLVAPENRAKYRAQVQSSFGIYVDAYANPVGSPWFIDGKGGARVDRLRQNVADALWAADEYVWVYGEKSKWWTYPHPSLKTMWDETLPGATDALRMAVDPADYGRRKLAEMVAAGTATNLTRNGDFSSDKAVGPTPDVMLDWKTGGAPAGWNTWLEDPTKGTFTWDRETGGGSARASGVAGGCFIQTIMPVEPGQVYAVQARYKLQGQGSASIRIRWQTPEGKWIHDQLDKLVYGSGKASDWQELTGVAEVPEGVGRLIILLGVGGQASDQDVAWFDDVKAYRLK
ncbi:MAG: hypothetical protein ABFE08_15345 [Armatimonadia bacterium]